MTQPTLSPGASGGGGGGGDGGRERTVGTGTDDTEPWESGNTDEGFWDDAFGSVDESIGRQFDDEQGGGVFDPDTFQDDSTDFGGGSNNWIAGTLETIRNPVDRVSNPLETVAGAADAAALSFDEGLGGLGSLVDDEPGNTAGPGQDDVDVPGTGVGASDDDGRSVDDNLLNNTLEGDGPLGIGPEQIVLLVAAIVALVLLRPVLSIVAGVAS